MVVLTAGALAVLILAIAETVPGASSGRAAPARIAPVTPSAAFVRRDLAPRDAVAPGVGKPGVCAPATVASGYVNPLARAHVKSERIDQGVDYAGSGTLAAIGAAKVTYVGTANTGWPGAFIEYRLRSGPDAGCYVYYAEGVNPRPGLHVGQTLAAGQAVASIVPMWSTGIEIGWGAGVNTRTAASKSHAWTPIDDEDNIATAAGKSFSGLVVSLGGPGGKNEG
jgi:hypothetical protein